jgi:hypothetical protein
MLCVYINIPLVYNNVDNKNCSLSLSLCEENHLVALRMSLPSLVRRRSSGEIRNLASISSSLLPAFGTSPDEGYFNLKKYTIAPYDRRYRYIYIYLIYLNTILNLFILLMCCGIE